MRKVTTLFLLFFIFILNTKGYTQTIDLSDFHIVSQSPLSNANKAQIDYLVEDFSAGIKADLKSKGYTVFTDAATSRLYSTELYGHQVKFHSGANQVVFGRALYDDTGRLSFITYVCDVINISGIPTLDPLRVHTASGNIALWGNEGERITSISATTNGLFKGEPTDTFVSEETFLETPQQKVEESFYATPSTTMEASNDGFSGTPKDNFTEMIGTPRLISTSVPEPEEKAKNTPSSKPFVGHQ